MSEFNFNPFPVIQTERLLLRQLEETDAPEIFFLRSDPSILKYIDIPKANNEADALAFINKINNFIAKNESMYWGMTLKGESKLIGTICLWNFIKENYRAEIGFVLHPAHQRKRYMQESIRSVVDYAFNKLNLHSIEGRVNPDNIASIKAMEKSGFNKEAHFREDYYLDGKFMDTAVYSLICEL